MFSSLVYVFFFSGSLKDGFYVAVKESVNTFSGIPELLNMPI